MGESGYIRVVLTKTLPNGNTIDPNVAKVEDDADPRRPRVQMVYHMRKTILYYS